MKVIDDDDVIRRKITTIHLKFTRSEDVLRYVNLFAYRICTLDNHVHWSTMWQFWKYPVSPIALSYTITNICNESWGQHGSFRKVPWQASWCMELSWNFYGTSLKVPWHFYGSPINVPWKFHKPWNVSWNLYGTFMDLLWNFYKSSMELLWKFHESSMKVP